MLKNIPKNISPELLKVLMEMGHGDEIVLSDGNFPSERINDKVIRYDSCGLVDLLKSILVLFPLDSEYSDEQVFLMEISPKDTYKPEIWNSYKKILDESKEKYTIAKIERFKFYERAKKAYAVVHTGETALYANIILKKGVVKTE